MKPEIVSLEYGMHNKDLEQSSARLLKGGSWKKQRIVTILPAGAMMPTKTALALRMLIFPPNQASHWMGAIGMEVGDAYSNAIEAVLEHPDLKDWEYILTVEWDNIPPADGVIKLIQDMEEHPEFACIGGLYWTKGGIETAVPQIWGDPKDPVLNYRPQPPVPGQIVECVGTGMGFNLWRISMFKDERLKRPWFKTLCSASEGVGTQDLAFWTDARKYGYRCAIDCRIPVGHYDVANDICY